MPRSRALTHDRIIQGAYALFYRHGFARVSMDAIAIRAGITKRTLYGHFDSKDTLLGEVLHHHHALALARIETWAGSLDRSDPKSIDQLFSDIALWSSGRRWSGAGFTRLVMELADLPGHPARKIARRHKAAVESRLSLALGSAEAGAEIMLLVEGTLALLLVHGDRRYAEIGAVAAKKLMRCAGGEG
jgi:AcrR family transcriptional regulator